MTKLLMIAVLLAACADDADPHDVGSCAAGWMGGGTLMCESACHDAPGNVVGDTTCMATDPRTGIEQMCPKAIMRDGGCCFFDGASTIRLYECN